MKILCSTALVITSASACGNGPHADESGENSVTKLLELRAREMTRLVDATLTEVDFASPRLLPADTAVSLGALQDDSSFTAGEGEGETVMTEAVPRPGDGRQRAELSPEEAERWLDSLEERVEAPLRKQIAEQLEPGRSRSGGQGW